MESGDKKDNDDKNDSISKQIVDYYKKYARNKDLPRYLCGSPLTYMPPIVQDEDDEALKEVENNADKQEMEDDLPKPISPASSVTSVRRLEWDNGADIGYGNCKEASTSTPSLNTCHSEMVHQIEVKSTESSDENCKIVESTGSESGEDRGHVTKMTSSFLRKQIGLPDAHSTPKLTHDPKPRLSGNSMQISKKSAINLTITKPIYVECLCARDSQNYSNKKIQTTQPEIVSKSTQTNAIEIVEEIPPKILRQSVITLAHSNGSGSHKTTSSTQTDSDIISDCNSFEYFSHEQKKVSSSSTSSSNYLSRALSMKQSKNLRTDVNKSIELLERLIESKRYDKKTKQHYIRKIVKKILNTQYRDDDNSSGSTQKNLPKLQRNSKPKNLTHHTFIENIPPTEPKRRTSFTLGADWKADKTESEKLYELSCKGQGDHLVGFAKKERQHQLNWIKNEIAHLQKLKILLEKNPKEHQTIEPKKTTTVYMLSQPSTSKATRNYVIETELGSSCSSSDRIDFNLYQNQDKQSYAVELLDKPPGNNHLYGDIEVVNEELTTNIRVKARKASEMNCNCTKPKPCDCLQTRLPTLIGAGKYETYPPSSRFNRGTSSNNCKCTDRSVQTTPPIPPTDVIVIETGCKSMQTSPTPTACKCTQNTQTLNDCGDTQASTSSTTTTTSSTTSIQSSVIPPTQICSCCKKKFDKLNELRAKLQTYPLCQPCYQRNTTIQTTPYFLSPNYVCNCYTMVETTTLNELKETIDDLNELDNVQTKKHKKKERQKHCTCVRVNAKNTRNYCDYCRCKLGKTSKNKNGIAYLLTFDYEKTLNKSADNLKNASLEEIRIRIPKRQKAKLFKERENERMRNTCSSNSTNTTTSNSSTTSLATKSSLPLQNYLNRNRPRFVETAEERRQYVQDHRINRERTKDHRKLKFLDEHPKKDDPKRIFNVAEMKKLTQKNYKKLPEVRQKKIDNREQQLRLANRAIANDFNKKLRDNVLKGKNSIPLDVLIVDLH